MSDSDNNNNFFSVLGDELKAVWQSLANGWRQTAVSLRNGLRQMRRAKMDYVVLELSGPLPERAGRLGNAYPPGHAYIPPDPAPLLRAAPRPVRPRPALS